MFWLFAGLGTATFLTLAGIAMLVRAVGQRRAP